MSDAVTDGQEVPVEFEIDDALVAELNRRKAEHEAGLRPGIPAAEMFRRLREERGGPRSQPRGEPMSVKDAAIEMIRALPENVSWADIAAECDARGGEPAEPEEWSDEFKAMIARRVEDVRSGKVKGIPAEEVMARLKAKYAS